MVDVKTPPLKIHQDPNTVEQDFGTVAPDVKENVVKKTALAEASKYKFFGDYFGPAKIEAKEVNIRPEDLSSHDAAFLRRPSVKITPEARAILDKLTAKRQSRLDEGDVLTSTRRVDTDNGPAILQLTQAKGEMSLTDALDKMGGIDKWATHINGLLGLTTQVVKQGEGGKPLYQIERMQTQGESDSAAELLLRELDDPNVHLLLATVNDMDKREVRVEGETPDGRRFVEMNWRVDDTANGSTLMDIGKIRMEETADGKVLITYTSTHQVNPVPITGVVGAKKLALLSATSSQDGEATGVAKALSDFFSGCVTKMQDMFGVPGA